MVEHRAVKAGLALLGLLALPTLLPAQVQTPHITGIQSGFNTLTNSVATNGPAITAGTPEPANCFGPGLCLNLFISGSFNPDDEGETVTWSENGSTPVSLNVLQQSNNLVVVNVPVAFYGAGTAGAVTIKVQEGVECEGPCPNDTSTFTINPPMAAISQLPMGVIGRPYSQQFFTGGTGNALSGPGFTASSPFGPGSPPGLTAPNPPLLTGTPTQSGMFSVATTVTDSWNNTLTLNSSNNSIVILAQLAIMTTTLPSGVINHAYTPTTATATGGTAPNNLTWSATGLPAGMSIAPATGVISGTPTASGQFSVTLSVTDGSQQTASSQPPISLTIYTPLTVTTNSLPSGAINHAYTQTTATASGGTAPNNLSWTATGLPAGMSISSSGVISGTPTASGPFSVTLSVSDGSGQSASSPAPISLTIYAILTVTTNSLPSGLINHAYTPTTATAAGGTAPNNLSWTATGLPAGMSINSSGVISGTPTVSGPFSVTLSVTDGSGQSASSPTPIPLTIYATLTITTTSLPAGLINHAYTPTTATASGGTAPNNLTWSATGLPTGMSISSSGVISGTPTVSGPFSVTLSVTDGSQQSASSPSPISLTINSLPSIGTTTLPTGRVQLAYSTTVTETGGVGPYTWAATGLPNGLTINASTGVISGTPTAAGTATVTVSVSDSNGQSAQATLSLQIIPLLNISASLPQGGVGAPYNGSISALGGVPPYTFVASGLPGGLSINSATGAISGTPASAGTSTFTVRVTDSGGTLAQSAQGTFSITINAPPPPPLTIVTPSLGGGTAGQIYSSLIAAGGGTGGYSFGVISGSLPPGVLLALGGQIYGTPTTPGTYSFTAQVTDSSTNTATHGYTIVIAPATLAVTGTPPATVPVNTTISVQFSATGGIAPYKIAISGSTPTGTSFSNGVLSGVASAPGSFSFTITASDSQTPPATASQGYTITVTPGPLTISANLPAGQVGQTYSGQFSATGGTGTGYVWSGSGNNGLSVSSSGAVSGTPTSVGNASLSVTVTDSSGKQASGTFSVAIAGPGLIVTTTSLTDAALTVAYSATLGASGGTTPYSWGATGLPNGLSVSSSTGVISGTPTQQGPFSVNVTVTDHSGATASATLSLTVDPAPVTISPPAITPPVLGSSFSVTFTATGGTPPYTFTATGLPGGVTMNPNGTLSGTPTSTGTFPIVVTVTDSKGQKTTQNLNLVVMLPTAPGTSLNGLPTNGTPATQVSSAVTFSAPYPTDVTVNLTLKFVPTSGADDPNVQFASGGRTTTVTVPAGSTTSLTNIAVQTGTVAGVITITEQLVASGTDITPSPAPTRTITIGASAPTVTSVTVTPGTNQFTVVVVGFDPTRAITQVNFTFTPAAGSTLQTSTVTIPAQTLFSQWYQSSAATPFGSQFSFTITFTVGGNVSSIQSVTVTLTNPTGTSTGGTAPV